MARAKPSLERGVPRKLEELALRGDDSRAFRQAVRPLLAAYVRFAAYCMNTCDPVTRAITSSVGDGLDAAEARRLFAIERRGRDLNPLAELGVTLPRVVTVCRATGGAPSKSERMRTIFAARGFTDELRAALALGKHVWGYLHLFRDGGGAFTALDVRRVEEVAPLLALGLARATVSSRGVPRTPFVPELVELDRRGRILRASLATRELLRAGDLDGHQPVPHGVYAARGAPHAGCFRAPSGEWLAFRRFDLGARAVVLLDRATSEEVTRTMLLALRLSARERQVAELVVTGLTNAQIAGELGIALYTAKDHVKALLEKTGVERRAELARRLATGE